ncbi:hypothetical protein [Endozoicomonas atrinae]|uniref:hypothetical protein n=1 Tax=Endozoicomonas atrinae TaxID=1333660 RepID=UPI000824152F|nr:hypothetical protein [Endozoicomonas atrinae]
MDSLYTGSLFGRNECYSNSLGEASEGKKESPKKRSPCKKNGSPKKDIPCDENVSGKLKPLADRQAQTVSPKKTAFSESSVQPLSGSVNAPDKVCFVPRLTPARYADELCRASHSLRENNLQRTLSKEGAVFNGVGSCKKDTDVVPRGAKRRLDFDSSANSFSDQPVKRFTQDSSKYRKTEASIIKLFSLEKKYGNKGVDIGGVKFELQFTQHDRQHSIALQLSEINAVVDRNPYISRIVLLDSGETYHFPYFGSVDTPCKARESIITTFPRDMFSVEPCQVIHSFSLGEDKSTPLECSKYEDGKYLIGQPARRSCVSSCEAMILMDFGRLDLVDIDKIRNTNLSRLATLKHDLENNGFRCTVLTLSKGMSSDVHEKETMVRKALDMKAEGGDAVVSVDAQIGGHVVMLDGFSELAGSEGDTSEPFIHVRDPFNKLRLRVKADYIFQISSEVLVIHHPGSRT